MKAGDTLELPKRFPWATAFLPPEEMLNEIKQSVIIIGHQEGFGSGFIVRADGLALTNYHVVEGAETVWVRVGESTEVRAQVIRTAPDGDLALLKLNGDGYKPILLGSGRKAASGMDVYAIGAPLDPNFLGYSVSKGIVSGVRKVEHFTLIQTDVSVNEGNSGGPLVNGYGEVIGIVTMKWEGVGVEGLAFAISVEDAKRELGLR
jgi:S1-C subfamily serine protease